MKNYYKIILTCLVILVSLCSSVYSAEIQDPIGASAELNMAATNVVTENLTNPDENNDIPIINLMVNLFESEYSYSFNESTSVVMACNPFDEQRAENEIYQPTSNISVGLKFSF